MPRYQLRRIDSLTPDERARAANAPPVAFGEIDMDALVEMMLPASGLRSRTAMRRQLEDQMAAAIESAMRGTAGDFVGIYEYVPTTPDIGGTFKVERRPGPVLRAIEAGYVYVPVDPRDLVPQPLVFHDERTGTTNERLSPGGAARLRGFDLAFDPAAGDEGVFVIDAIDGAEFKLPRGGGPGEDLREGASGAEDSAANGSPVDGSPVDGSPADGSQNISPTAEVAPVAPAAEASPAGPPHANADSLTEIHLQIPADLPSGVYLLELRSRLGGADLRAGRLPVELRV